MKYQFFLSKRNKTFHFVSIYMSWPCVAEHHKSWAVELASAITMGQGEDGQND